LFQRLKKWGTFPGRRIRVEQKKNKDLEGQMKINFPFKCTDNYFDDIEDIFGPADNEEEAEARKPINVLRCKLCKNLVSICSVCHKPFMEYSYVHCTNFVDKAPEHRCGGCAEKWKITNKGKGYLKKHA